MFEWGKTRQKTIFNVYLKFMDSIRIKAYTHDINEFVGEFESISLACRRLFIKSRQAANKYVLARKKGEKGLLSYKDKKRYHLEQCHT